MWVGCWRRSGEAERSAKWGPRCSSVSEIVEHAAATMSARDHGHARAAMRSAARPRSRPPKRLAVLTCLLSTNACCPEESPSPRCRKVNWRSLLAATGSTRRRRPASPARRQGGGWVTGAAARSAPNWFARSPSFSPRLLVFFELSNSRSMASSRSSPSAFPRWPSPAWSAMSGRGAPGGGLRQYRPELVFHAAAYKHVPLMENENAWQR